MHILISNDDGIRSEGLRVLVETFREAEHRVTVCAPDRERSASGHAITMRDPLFVERVDGFNGVAAFSINGTPADCVRLGLLNLAGDPVDLVVSGINNGPNLGSDTLYSGTVSAAMEAVLLGCSGLAVSLCGHERPDLLPNVALWARRVAEKMASHESGRQRLYNLNVPVLPPEEILGLRLATLSRKCCARMYSHNVSPFGHEHCWLTEWPEGEREPGTDSFLISEGYVTLTPLRWSLMNEAALGEMELYQKMR